MRRALGAICHSAIGDADFFAIRVKRTDGRGNILIETLRDFICLEARAFRQIGNSNSGYDLVWGKRRLAYEIKKRAEGYYVVIQARSEPPAMAELHRTLSLADEVIRHKVLRIPEAAYGPPVSRDAVVAE